MTSVVSRKLPFYNFAILVICEDIMWYFAWILGVLLACAFGIINVMWMEAEDMLDMQDNLES